MEERRTNKNGLGLGLSLRREKFWHFSGILWLLRACPRMKFPPSYQECWLILLRWLTWCLGPQVPTLHFSSSLSLTIAFPWLSITPICSLLWVLAFPFLSSSGLIGNLVRKPFVWVLHQNRQRNPLTGPYPCPQNECSLSCHT